MRMQDTRTPSGTQHKASSRSEVVMSSIYRTSPAKRSKAGTGCGKSGGGGGGGSASWTLVGPVPEKGNPLWPCPRQGCPGFLLTKTRKNSNSQYAVCETRRLDDANTCQAFYNVNKKHWGTNSGLARTCDWCDGDTGESPSIGVPSDGTDSSSKGKFPFVPVRLE